MYIFLVDKDRKPLYPTKRIDMVTKWIRQGKARRLTSSGVVQVFKKFSNKTITHIKYSLGIDPGYINIGYCLTKINTKTDTAIVFVYGVGEINTPKIKKDLETRKIHRRSRRRHRRLRAKRRHKRNNSGIKFRKPRWKNRKNKSKLAPTVRYLVTNHSNFINKLYNRCRFDELHLEYNKFDIHKLINPTVYRYQYQQGTKYNIGLTNSKQYVLYRDNYTCQKCHTNKPNTKLQVHHIVPRSNGGNDHHSNLVTLCEKCHTKIHNMTSLPKFHVSNTITLRDASVVNTGMKYLVDELTSNFDKVYITYGSNTKDTRYKYNISKSHSNDAMVISLSSCDGLMYDINEVKYNNYTCDYVKFKRQDRAVVNSQRDRYYYINGNKVAHNRRSKTTSKENDNFSLEEYKQFDGYKYKFTVKPAIKILNTPRKLKQFNPGDICRETKTGNKIIVKGYSKSQGIITDFLSGKKYKFNQIRKVCNNTGFVII